MSGLSNPGGAAAPGVARRAVLVAGVAGLAVAGGCAAAPPAEPGTAAEPAPGPTAPEPTAPESAAGSAGTPLGPASDVPVGGGAVFAALEVVVTQPTAGTFRGFSAVCTHTACIVDKVVDGTIECPCHGSRYRLDGTVAKGPAPRPLTERAVTVVDGRIVLT